MKKTIFIIITILLVAAMIVPLIDFRKVGSRNLDGANSEPAIGGQDNQTFSLPIEQVIPERCPIGSSYKKDWQITACEPFDGDTGLWTGESNGTQVNVQGDKYVFDNSDASTQSDSNGYTFPILVGAARDVMLSVNGDMECLTGDCAWGVFIRSTGETMTYIFMIHNDGNYSLTGLSPQETDQALGNIQAASNSIIRKSGENTIVAIAEGAQMMFFVNDVLLAAHEAYDASNPTFGVIVWGSPGTRAYTRLDDILAKAN